jgi:hypothetical protein
MLVHIIKHSWLGFSRSDFFRKSLTVQGIILFTLFMFAVYIYGFGKRFPGILLENFPQRQPGEWVFSSLIYIMIVDLLIRFLSQKLPMNYIRPYLHLPVRWQIPSFYWLARSLFHPLNVYLLFFFRPFISQTINPETSSQGMGVAGILLLLLLNHSIYICMKTSVGRKSTGGKILGLLVLILVLASFLQPEMAMRFSLNVFLGFVNGETLVFATLISLILGLHVITYFNLKETFYILQDERKTVKIYNTGFLAQRILNLHHVYGQYWWLEWQLVTRNKRSRVNFWLVPLVSIGFMIYIISSGVTEYGAFAVLFFLIAGGYGTTHLQHTLSWESRFFDFMATRDFELQHFLLAKYYFYVCLSAIQLALFVPILAIYDISLLILYLGLFTYVCGVGYYVLFRLGINNSSRFDPNGKASFNMEGLSGTKFLITLGLYLSIVPFFILNFFIPFPHSGVLLMILIGGSMMAFHRKWITGFARRLSRQKYRNMAIYRNN